METSRASTGSLRFVPREEGNEISKVNFDLNTGTAVDSLSTTRTD